MAETVPCAIQPWPRGALSEVPLSVEPSARLRHWLIAEIGLCPAAAGGVDRMKIALLGTGFGQAHAAVYAQRPDVDEVVVFGRTPEKLVKISGQFGFAATTDLDDVISDPSVDLVDICLPTRLHAEIAVRAMQAGQDVLIELPLASTLKGAHRIVTAQQATGRHAFVGMFSRFSP